MKKLIIILMLLPMMAMSQQSFFQEWNKYLSECNELVADTIKQTGIVNFKVVPIKVGNEIAYYGSMPIDTVWENVECNEYKFSKSISLTAGYGITLNYDYPSTVTLSGSGIIYSDIKLKNQIKITRDKICIIKKRKASFDDFFKWCIENKLIEMN